MRRFLVIAAAATILQTGPAAAHAFLKSATPAVGGTVATPPAQVVITFTEGVEPSFSTITVQDAAGAKVDDGKVHLAGGDTILAVGLQPLKPGDYRVVWHATATDTHKTEGSYAFHIKK